MDAMLAVVWESRGEDMLENKIGVMDTRFVKFLKKEHERFTRAKNPPVPFNWSQSMRQYVAGKVQFRSQRLKWMVDVDTIYAPLALTDKHWVALSINFLMGTVMVLDCNQRLTDDAKLPKLLEPITQVMPLILRDLVDPGLEPSSWFDCERGLGISQHEGTGDSGPMTAKFIELDGQGHSCEELNDESVDEFRLKYAVDVYEQFVEPL